MAILLGYTAEYATRLAEQEYQTCCRLQWHLHVQQEDAYEMGLELVAVLFHHLQTCNQEGGLAKCQTHLLCLCWHSWRDIVTQYQAECEFDELQRALKKEAMPLTTESILEYAELDQGCQMCEVV